MSEELSFPYTPLPDHRLPPDEVLSELVGKKGHDRAWRGGRVYNLVYTAGEAHHHHLEQALDLYAAENGLNVLAFPSIGYLQHDLVRITANLLGAEDPAAGGGVGRAT